MPTVSTTLLPRALGALLLAPILSTGIGASAEAAPSNWKAICANAMCFHKNPHRYSDGRMYYYLSYRGPRISHYNLRYRESGNREAQIEISAVSDKNRSGAKYMIVRPGGKYTVAIQACNRGGLFQKSGCTGWYRITYFGPE